VPPSEKTRAGIDALRRRQSKTTTGRLENALLLLCAFAPLRETIFLPPSRQGAKQAPLIFTLPFYLLRRLIK
jgi:hypothetical protein